MAAAPIADYLRTPLAKDRGRSGDRDAVRAFITRPHRGFIRIPLTHELWAWRRNMAILAAGKTRRVWLNPEHWGTDRIDVPADKALGVAAIPVVWPNTPALIPWGDTFVTGTAPQGMDADLGAFVDYDDASAKGWELLGMRKPNPIEAIVLTWRSKPWIFGTPTFTPWDWQADQLALRVGSTTLGHGGKRRGGKMKGIIRASEIQAGVIEHAISLASSKINHGPGGARSVLPSTRVEFPDRDPWATTNPTPAGYLPGVNFAHGQAFAVDLTRAEIEQRLDSQGLINERRRVARIVLTAMVDYGMEEDESGSGQDDQAETDGPLGALTAADSYNVMDRLIPAERVYALNPAA